MVGSSPEHDTVSRNTATGPWSGCETSWRNAPLCAVNSMVLGAVLLFFLGLALGAAWTAQALQPKLRQQAEERRKLNEAWAAVTAARKQRVSCPRCGYRLTDRDWYYRTQTPVEEPPDED